MSYQKCPICNGHRKNAMDIRCKPCEGTGLISELTGLPPANKKVQPRKSNFSSGDFRDDENRESQQEYFGKK